MKCRDEMKLVRGKIKKNDNFSFDSLLILILLRFVLMVELLVCFMSFFPPIFFQL